MRGDRMEKLRESLGLSRDGLGKMLNTSRVTIWRWEKGESEPDDETKVALARILNTTAAFLMGETDEPAPPKTGDTKKSVPEETDFANAHYDPDEILVPVYQMISVCAGRGFDNSACTPEIIRMLPLKRRDLGNSPEDAYMAIEVDGRSMEPKIHDGAIVVVDMSRKNPAPGDICYVRYQPNGGFHKDAVKFCYPTRDGGLELRSAEGSGIPPLTFSPDELREGYVEIVGTVILKLSLERI